MYGFLPPPKSTREAYIVRVEIAQLTPAVGFCDRGNTCRFLWDLGLVDELLDLTL